jgi:predicted transcriptional regulator
VVEPQVELYHDQIVDHGLRVTMVATEAVLDRLVSEHRERFVATLDTGRVEVYRATRPVDYGLAVTDTDDGGEMFLSVYGDDGMVGTVGNATPEAVAWARDRVDARLDAADPVSLP